MTSVRIPRVDGHRLFTDDTYGDVINNYINNVFGWLFDGLKDETISLAYIDHKEIRPGCYQRYIFHPSVKQPGYIQFSAVWMVNGKADPGYDEQYLTREIFVRSMHGHNGITLNIIEAEGRTNDILH